jgi:hypothetical protein
VLTGHVHVYLLAGPLYMANVSSIMLKAFMGTL